MSEAANEWYRANTEHKKRKSREWRRANPLLAQLHSLRARAKRLGIPWHITADDIVVPSHCPVLGIRLRRGRGVPRASSPSIDRVNSRRGYHPDNVVVISYRANMLKRDVTLKEAEAIVRYMRRNSK